MSQKTSFTVGMTCQGCAGAVTRILRKIEGVTEVETDVPTQKVVVEHSADPQVLLAALKKWGDAGNKKVELDAA